MEELIGLLKNRKPHEINILKKTLQTKGGAVKLLLDEKGKIKKAYKSKEEEVL